MIVDVPTDKIAACQCGFKPPTYSIAYGRTPYAIHCQTCDKSLHGGHNDPQEMFDLWERLVAPRIDTGVVYDIRYRGRTKDCAYDEEVDFKKPRVFEVRCMGLFVHGAALRAPRKDQIQHPR